MDQIFSLNEMNYLVALESFESAPTWRIVDPGIFWIAKCKNESCEAYKRDVICNAGFGVFDLSMQAAINICPMCGENVENAKNCGFFNAKWSFFGVDNRGNERRGNGEAGMDSYTTFEDGEDAQWRVLRIEVEPIINLT